MSLRTIQRAAVAGALTLGVLSATGCDDDDKKGRNDGDTDAGPDGGPGGDDGGPGGGMDAGPDSGGDELAACTGSGDKDCVCEVAGEDGTSDETCSPVDTGVIALSACCDEKHGGRCGAFVPVPGPLNGCHATGLEGQPSSHCGTFLDSVDGAGNKNGLYDAEIPGFGAVQLPGCCTPNGLCGLLVDSFTVLDENGQEGPTFNVGLGCIPITDFANTGSGADAGTPDAGADVEPVSPFCQANAPIGDAGVAENDEACPPLLNFPQLGISLCSVLNEQFGGILIGCPDDDPTAPFPGWACAAQGGKLVNGNDPEVGDCMEYVPEFVRGCGDTQGENCVPNVPANVFGCVDIDADGFPAEARTALLAGFPEYICGCGEGVEPNPLCLPNVGAAHCGGVDVTAQDHPALAQLPEYLCGCRDGEPSPTSAPCLRNVDPDLCGTQAVEQGPIPGIPNLLCGCGDQAEGTFVNTDALCLDNVPAEICGAVPACTEEGGTGTEAGCAEGETCLDLFGTGGTVSGPNATGDGTTNGDDIPDRCVATPPT